MNVFRGYTAAGATWPIPGDIPRRASEMASSSSEVADRPLVNNGWVVRNDIRPCWRPVRGCAVRPACQRAGPQAAGTPADLPLRAATDAATGRYAIISMNFPGRAPSRTMNILLAPRWLAAAHAYWQRSIRRQDDDRFGAAALLLMLAQAMCCTSSSATCCITRHRKRDRAAGRYREAAVLVLANDVCGLAEIVIR